MLRKVTIGTECNLLRSILKKPNRIEPASLNIGYAKIC